MTKEELLILKEKKERLEQLYRDASDLVDLIEHIKYLMHFINNTKNVYDIAIMTDYNASVQLGIKNLEPLRPILLSQLTKKLKHAEQQLKDLQNE